MSRWVDQYETHAFRASLDGGFFVFLTLIVMFILGIYLLSL